MTVSNCLSHIALSSTEYTTSIVPASAQTVIKDELRVKEINGGELIDLSNVTPQETIVGDHVEITYYNAFTILNTQLVYGTFTFNLTIGDQEYAISADMDSGSEYSNIFTANVCTSELLPNYSFMFNLSTTILVIWIQANNYVANSATVSSFSTNGNSALITSDALTIGTGNITTIVGNNINSNTISTNTLYSTTTETNTVKLWLSGTNYLSVVASDIPITAAGTSEEIFENPDDYITDPFTNQPCFVNASHIKDMITLGSVIRGTETISNQVVPVLNALCCLNMKYLNSSGSTTLHYGDMFYLTGATIRVQFQGNTIDVSGPRFYVLGDYTLNANADYIPVMCVRIE